MLSLVVIWTTVTHSLGAYLGSTSTSYSVFKVVQLTLLETRVNFPALHLFLKNCIGPLLTIAHVSKVPPCFTNSFNEVFNNTLILISTSTAVVTTPEWPDPFKMLYISKICTIHWQQFAISFAPPPFDLVGWRLLIYAYWIWYVRP